MSNLLSKFSDFKGKKFLVVDDFPEFRTAIKRMVEAFGGEDIDTASSGDDAMERIKANKYDGILCDYNIGIGKDGQQVLEEAKHRKLLSPLQIFVLLTAESTAEMVMGALEYEPDGYLIKPFTKEMLHNRLIKITNIKKEMYDIHKAYSDGNIDESIKLCDEKIAEGGRVSVLALKFKGNALIKNSKTEEAYTFYDSLITQKRLPWVIMGLGRAYYDKGEYDKALELFQELISQNEVCVEAYDWKAKCLWKLDDLREAQSVLEKATKLSSKAILRQQLLSKIALLNGDLDVAEKALRAAVQLGKYSCYRDPEDHLNLAKVLISNSQDGNVRAANEAVATLENLSNLYISNADVLLKCNVHLANAMIAANRKDKAKQLFRKVDEMLKKGKLLEDDLKKILGEGMIELGDKERGAEIIKEISDNKG